jgi:hypothetical protein
MTAHSRTTMTAAALRPHHYVEWPPSAASTLSSAVTRSRRVKVRNTVSFLNRFSRLLTRFVTACSFAALVFCTSPSRPSFVAETNTDLFFRLSFFLFFRRFSPCTEARRLATMSTCNSFVSLGTVLPSSTVERKEGKKSDGCEWVR